MKFSAYGSVQGALQSWLGLASFASAESLGRFAWLLVARSWNLDSVGSFHFCIVRTPMAFVSRAMSS
jgi:hypothetical protein